jgi:hypothetical protein
MPDGFFPVGSFSRYTFEGNGRPQKVGSSGSQSVPSSGGAEASAVALGQMVAAGPQTGESDTVAAGDGDELDELQAGTTITARARRQTAQPRVLGVTRR